MEFWTENGRNRRIHGKSFLEIPFWDMRLLWREPFTVSGIWVMWLSYFAQKEGLFQTVYEKPAV